MRVRVEYQGTRDARGRFTADGQRVKNAVYRDLSQRVASNAANNLRAQTSSGSRRAAANRRWQVSTGRLARAVESKSNQRLYPDGFGFMVKNVLNVEVPYWAAIEYGTSRHVGRRLVYRRGEIVGSTTGRRGPMIRKPIQPHRFASQAWNEANFQKSDWVKAMLRDAYPRLLK